MKHRRSGRKPYDGESKSKVVLVTGCEVSLFGRGFLPGEDVYARIGQLSAPGPALFAEYPKAIRRLNEFLAKAAAAARKRFAGPVTYAAGPWEEVDWTPFDVVSVDAYRDRNNAERFDQQLAALFVHGKSVAVTEFGCCTYRGAGDRGAAGWMILEGEGESERVNGEYVRDESEQVRYLRELVEHLRAPRHRHRVLVYVRILEPDTPSRGSQGSGSCVVRSGESDRRAESDTGRLLEAEGRIRGIPGDERVTIGRRARRRSGELPATKTTVSR